ncbi:MAG TPA: DNA translocase FtsK [Candidatus Omnitrophota bacterium]|nr:DNA translocase FtsK [Candidatus Omnitrophota bacterium]
MKERRLNEIKGVILIAAGLIVLASLVSFDPFDLSFYTSHPNFPAHNWIRTFGAYFAGAILFLFGWAGYLIPVFILFLGVRIFRHDIPDLRVPRMVGLLVLIVSVSSLVGMFNSSNNALSFSYGGILGYAISTFVSTYFGKLGGFIVFVTLILLSLALVTEVLISTLLMHATSKVKDMAEPLSGLGRTGGKPFNRRQPKEDQEPKQEKISLMAQMKAKIQEAVHKPGMEEEKPRIQIKDHLKEKNGEEKPKPKERPKEVNIGDYRLPTIDLLEDAPAVKQVAEDLEGNARVLEETFSDFGISVKVTDIERGPVITRYELEPAPGVKVARIVSFEDDLALAMKAQSVRIIAPIPGKARVGVEVPNSHSVSVYLKDVLASEEFTSSKSKLTLAMGKDIAGHPVVADLGDMPHLLVAGTTGSGKTVCINTLIMSLLMRNSPNELKLLMVDPKKVEMAHYNGLPHLICPVVTDAKKASAALGWVVNEMQERYDLLQQAVARNITQYNQKREKDKLPYIVVVIDEMADLMMVSRDQIESAITRLAQLARAVGIHLIMATQRPSVDVITGVIKANFPARISFKVASKVDSRTVLDANGADKLLGKGDLLFMNPGDEKLTRAQGAWVKDREIEALVDFIKAQAQPVYNDAILEEQQKSAQGETGEKDELYDEAVRVVLESNQASVSILQRKMRLSHTRAARLIDAMEAEGIVGPFEGSKPRRIVIDRDAWIRNSVLNKNEG